MYFAILHLVRATPASGRQRRVPLPSRRRWRDAAHRLSIGPRGHNDTSCPFVRKQRPSSFFYRVSVVAFVCLDLWCRQFGQSLFSRALRSKHTHTNTQTEGLVSRGNSAPLIPWAFSQINHPFPSVTPLPWSTLSLTKHTHTRRRINTHSPSWKVCLTTSKSLSQLYHSGTGLSVAEGHETQVRTVV